MILMGPFYLRFFHDSTNNLTPQGAAPAGISPPSPLQCSAQPWGCSSPADGAPRSPALFAEELFHPHCSAHHQELLDTPGNPAQTGILPRDPSWDMECGLTHGGGIPVSQPCTFPLSSSLDKGLKLFFPLSPKLQDLVITRNPEGIRINIVIIMDNHHYLDNFDLKLESPSHSQSLKEKQTNKLKLQFSVPG